MIHVVVGIMINPEGEVLVAERQMQKFQGGRWEFPGGKVEKDETPLAALQRELDEEIGVEVQQARPLQQLRNTYPDKEILLDVWKVTEYNGEPLGKEGQKIRWVHLDVLFSIEIPDANIPIVKMLQNKLT